ncbi:phage replisome organizer N-terminal domain-containing protein [Candidatus Merdisoma sp. JLR.KK006]|uniref:phage replisome organizer N-terminal domain-containing protein n=1 Tax=Candidatus Merdisoma sp. JLR.KK006 TaxID=3112626 RepID=UPI002FF20D19
MADNKKYYYLKLKEGFFDSEDMKLLQGMKDGYLYSDILLKLYLQSLRQEGRLMYRGIVPYTPEMIATITHHQIGTVEKAMDILEQMGFIEILDNGAIYMLDIQNFIGQSSSEADRRRAYRNMIDTEKLRISEYRNVTNVTTNDGQMSDKSIPEIRDQRLDIRDKENKNILAQSSDKQTSEPEADVEALLLNDGTEWRPTEALFAEYVRLYPKVDVKQQFNEMRCWCLSNPQKRKTKKGIKRFVNSWLAREQDKGGNRAIDYKAQKKSQFHNFKERKYAPEEMEKFINM